VDEGGGIPSKFDRGGVVRESVEERQKKLKSVSTRKRGTWKRGR